MKYTPKRIKQAWNALNLPQSGLEAMEHRLDCSKDIEELREIWGDLNFPPMLFGMFIDEMDFEVMGKPWRFPSDKEIV